jgi:hypothetical protein
MPIKIERNGVEAEVEDRYVSDFISDGWKRLEPEILPPKTADEHILHVMNLLSKDDIEEYVKKYFGVDLDKRGNLETVAEKAIGIINESGRTD